MLCLILHNFHDYSCISDIYDEYSARQHVQHVRSILVAPPSYSSNLGPSNVTPSFLRSNESSVAELAQAAQQGGNNLSILNPKEKPEVCECVRSVVFSRFNPPPGQRRMRGDLVYLEVCI